MIAIRFMSPARPVKRIPYSFTWAMPLNELTFCPPEFLLTGGDSRSSPTCPGLQQGAVESVDPQRDRAAAHLGREPQRILTAVNGVDSPDEHPAHPQVENPAEDQRATKPLADNHVPQARNQPPEQPGKGAKILLLCVSCFSHGRIEPRIPSDGRP